MTAHPAPLPFQRVFNGCESGKSSGQLFVTSDLRQTKPGTKQPFERASRALAFMRREERGSKSAAAYAHLYSVLCKSSNIWYEHNGSSDAAWRILPGHVMLSFLVINPLTFLLVFFGSLTDTCRHICTYTTRPATLRHTQHTPRSLTFSTAYVISGLLLAQHPVSLQDTFFSFSGCKRAKVRRPKPFSNR